MRIYRFDDNRLGVVQEDSVRDVTAAPGDTIVVEMQGIGRTEVSVRLSSTAG